MRQLVNAEATQHSMKLVQMGAEVQQINSKMYYVVFELTHVTLEYVYNINSKKKYFLERIKPYPLPMRQFDTEDDLLDIIEIDVEQFKNAEHSHNIDAFITINKKLNDTIKRFEDVFLYYNVPEIETEIILGKIAEIDQEIEKTIEQSERVYFGKEPDNL